MRATQAFRTLAEATVDDLLRLSPETATDLGEHAYDDRLDDLTAAGLAHARETVVRRRDQLDALDGAALDGAALDGAGLDVDDGVDAQVLRNALERRVFELDVLRRPSWDPLAWLPGDALYPLLVRDTVPVGQRLESLAARLAAVPDRLAAARATLTAMPSAHRDTAVTQAAGTVALVRAEVDRLLDREPGLRSRVAPAQEAAATALERYGEWLAGQPAEGDPRLGAEAFAARLRLTLDSGLGAAEVVVRAREHLEEVTAQLAEVARDWTGSRDGDDAVIRQALDRVATDVPDDTTVVARARTALAETTDLVRRHALLQLPADPCEVEVMPEFRRGVAVAYCDPPGPLEVGGTTRFAISPTPADWSPGRVASFYREYNSAMITNLTVHEAMPGHVVQLALSRRYAGATRVRQVLQSGSFHEGWAVHAERIVVGLGHGGVPVRLQQLKMALRMTLNAILDAGVHAGGMTEQEGLELLTRRGFQEEGEAVGKWRRALLTSGQLSTYFVGYLELAPVLAGRTTYDEVLAHGSPPPRHLPALLRSGG